MGQKKRVLPHNKRLILRSFIAGIVILTSQNAGAVPADQIVIEPVKTVVVATAEASVRRPNEEVEQQVREYFHDIPVMIEIARCESRYRQYEENGSVLLGDITRDLGVMQINEYYHLDAAAHLGLDLHDLEDNMAYARYLYNREGTKPWNSSSKCWKNRQIALR